jgi:hypothetical protein
MIKLRTMRCTEHVACMRQFRNTKFWSQNLKGNISVDGIHLAHNKAQHHSLVNVGNIKCEQFAW